MGSLIINAIGAVATCLVLLVIAVTKFEHGAYMVILLIPVLVFLYRQIYKHYISVARELSYAPAYKPKPLEPVRHTAIVPISGIHPGVVSALKYGLSISRDVRACYVELDPVATERLKEQWKRWAPEVPLVILKSPYRSVIAPLIEYIDDVEKITHDEMITVIIPEFVTAKWYHQFLHNQTALILRAALRYKPRKVVTSVRHHLGRKDSLTD
jgi:hypothetical protein